MWVHLSSLLRIELFINSQYVSPGEKVALSLHGFRKYPNPPHRWFLGLKPHPSGNSFIFSVKNFGFWQPPPPRNVQWPSWVGMDIFWNWTLPRVEEGGVGHGHACILHAFHTLAPCLSLPCHFTFSVTKIMHVEILFPPPPTFCPFLSCHL